jgi:D-glycerate 3-kinase
MNGEPTKIPAYDKALFSGQGDRLPERDWSMVSKRSSRSVQIVILEGWSVGFRALAPERVQAKWDAPSRTLKQHTLEHLLLLNDKLKPYESIWDYFHVFIQIDAEDEEYVYTWRQEQEDYLRLSRDDPQAGMTAEQVRKFVDGFYPGYELYTHGLRQGWNSDKPDNQLRIVVGPDRGIKQVTRL